MSDKTQSKDTAKSSTVNDDAGSKQVQEMFDQEHEQGFRGTEVDPTPNENYTLQGVASDKPTPETDEKAARGARAALEARG